MEHIWPPVCACSNSYPKVFFDARLRTPITHNVSTLMRTVTVVTICHVCLTASSNPGIPERRKLDVTTITEVVTVWQQTHLIVFELAGMITFVVWHEELPQQKSGCLLFKRRIISLALSVHWHRFMCTKREITKIIITIILYLCFVECIMKMSTWKDCLNDHQAKFILVLILCCFSIELYSPCSVCRWRAWASAPGHYHSIIVPAGQFQNSEGHFRWSRVEFHCRTSSSLLYRNRNSLYSGVRS